MMIRRRVGNTRLRTGTPALAALLLAVTLGGCDQQRVEGDPPPPFAELRERYNSRTGQIEQIFARGNIEVRWEDDRGRRNFEQGDAHLYLRLPSELALAISKLSNTMYWVGGDEERFWYFDLNPPSGEPRQAVVGHHADIARTGLEDVPMPVRPDQLVHLLGVAEMPAPVDAQPPRVTREDGADVAIIAADAEGEAFWRYELDPDNHRPRRIVLLDGEGEELVASALSRYEPLQRHEVPPGGWPYVPTRIEITTPATGRASLTLFLQDPSDGEDRDRIRDVHFDFERLADMLDPQEVRRVDNP